MENALFRSDNAGYNWQRVAMPARPPFRDARPNPDAHLFNDLQFADPPNGWIVGAGGLVLATSDGGITWTKQKSGTQNNLTRVAALNRNAAWIGGSNRTILATGSGGR